MVCGEVFKNPIERKGAVPPQGAKFSDYKPQTISIFSILFFPYFCPTFLGILLYNGLSLIRSSKNEGGIKSDA